MLKKIGKTSEEIIAAGAPAAQSVSQPAKRTGKKETVYYFFLSVATKALTYVLLLAFANLFAPVDYGYASFALSVFTVASMLVFPGFTTILVPAFVLRRETEFASAFWATGIASFAFALGTLAIATRFTMIWPFAFCFIFSWVTMAARVVMTAEKRFHWIQATELLFVALSVALTVAFRGFGGRGIVYAYTLSVLAVTLASVALERRALARIAAARSPRSIDWSVVKKYWLKGVAVLVLLLSFQYLGRNDSIVLGVLSTFENVARYNMASAVAGVLSVFSVSISMFLLARNSELGKKQSELVFLRSVRIAFVLNLVSAIALASLAGVVVTAFFPKYAGIELFVSLLAASTLFYSLFFLYVTHLSARLSPEKALKPILAGMLVNLVLDVALIPLYGVLGICVATLSASALTFVLCRISFNKRAFAFVVFSPAFIIAAFFLNVYGLLLLLPALAIAFWTRAFEKSDLDAILAVVKRIISKISFAIHLTNER